MVNTQKHGFTFSKALLALSVIIIIAAVTIPNLIYSNKQEAMNNAANLFNSKLKKALKEMDSQSVLTGHESTKDFVEELGNYINITKVCDSNELSACFVNEFYTNKATFNVNNLQESQNLNKNTDYGTETIGVIFENGISALIAYNINASQNPLASQAVKIPSSAVAKTIQVGFTTDALSILYDVTGFSGPNFYGKDTKGKYNDIRGLNISIQ